MLGKLVTAEEARETVMLALAAAPSDKVERLRGLCENGGFEGNSREKCFYGSLGIETEGKELDFAETFFLRVRRYHTFETCPELAHLSMWCDEHLNGLAYGNLNVGDLRPELAGVS